MEPCPACGLESPSMKHIYGELKDAIRVRQSDSIGIASLAASLAEERRKVHGAKEEFKCYHDGNDGNDTHFCGKCDSRIASMDDLEAPGSNIIDKTTIARDSCPSCASLNAVIDLRDKECASLRAECDESIRMYDDADKELRRRRSALAAKEKECERLRDREGLVTFLRKFHPDKWYPSAWKDNPESLIDAIIKYVEEG